MGWVRISDDFYDNDKITEVGPLGMALYVAAMGFCNRNLTDGYFKKSKARLLLDFDGIGITTVTGELFAAGVDGDDAAALVIGWMVAADLWHESGHACDECHARDDGGEPGPREYLIHDYLKFQLSKAEIEAKAEATRKRVEAWRAARKNGNGVSNSVTNSVRTQDVTPDVRDTPTPTPTPTPSTSSVVTSRRGVTESNARESEPPSKCSKHINHTNPPNCGACADARRRHEAWQAAQQENQLAERRRIRAERNACPYCDENGMRETPTGVARCDHQESDSA